MQTIKGKEEKLIMIVSSNRKLTRFLMDLDERIEEIEKDNGEWCRCSVCGKKQRLNSHKSK